MSVPAYTAQFLKMYECFTCMYVFTLCACLVLMEVRSEIPETEVTGSWLGDDTTWVPSEDKVSQWSPGCLRLATAFKLQPPECWYDESPHPASLLPSQLTQEHCCSHLQLNAGKVIVSSRRNIGQLLRSDLPDTGFPKVHTGQAKECGVKSKSLALRTRIRWRPPSYRSVTFLGTLWEVCASAV